MKPFFGINVAGAKSKVACSTYRAAHVQYLTCLELAPCISHVLNIRSTFLLSLWCCVLHLCRALESSPAPRKMSFCYWSLLHTWTAEVDNLAVTRPVPWSWRSFYHRLLGSSGPRRTLRKHVEKCAQAPLFRWPCLRESCCIDRKLIQGRLGERSRASPLIWWTSQSLCEFICFGDDYHVVVNGASRLWVERGHLEELQGAHAL